MVAPEWVVQHPHSAREPGATNRTHGISTQRRANETVAATSAVSCPQKPDRLKVPCRGHVRAVPVLLLQSQNAQVIRHLRHGSPPRLMALQPIRVPNPGKS